MVRIPAVVRRRLNRLGTRSVLAILALYSLAVAVGVYLLPERVALAAAALVLLVHVGVIGLVTLQIYRGVRRAKAPAHDDDVLAGDPWPTSVHKGQLTDKDRSNLRVWHARLFKGFSDTSLKELRRVVTTPAGSPAYRLAVAEMMLDWYAEKERRVPAGSPRRFDIVITSHFALPGGTTSANAEEIRAYRKAGLKVGLLHHPVYHWDVGRAIDQKILDLVDDEQVCLLGVEDWAECDLMIVRFPPAMMRLLDDRPRIVPDRTVLVVNQTPYSYYGPEGGTSVAWDVRTVHQNLTDWVGDHTWYPIGPVVRDALKLHHTEEIERIDIAEEFWYESIDVAEWRRERPRNRDKGPFRIGRHSRDTTMKWPDTAELVRACYPDEDDYEIRILGGVDAARKTLGDLPGNWVDYPFGSVSAREFLTEIDVMVYFISSQGAEAFGRAPLEAMAVGLPCVMDHRFEELFGPAAVYCSPAEVKGVLERLRTDPDYYAEQAERAIKYVDANFSHQAQLARVARLGVTGLDRASNLAG